MQEYEDELRKILSKIAACEKYFGEFATPNKIQINTSKLPIIYVDLIGEKPSSNYELKLEFSLYIAHAAFSKNPKTREKNQHEISELLLSINKALFSTAISDSQPCELKGSRKLIDSKIDSAYITIFQKNLEFTIPQNYIQGVDID